MDPYWIPFQARPNRPRIHLITILPKKVAWEAVLGAGALGALLGNVAGGNLLKNAALLGAGAVALNFIKNVSF